MDSKDASRSAQKPTKQPRTALRLIFFLTMAVPAPTIRSLEATDGAPNDMVTNTSAPVIESSKVAPSLAPIVAKEDETSPAPSEPPAEANLEPEPSLAPNKSSTPSPTIRPSVFLTQSPSTKPSKVKGKIAGPTPQPVDKVAVPFPTLQNPTSPVAPVEAPSFDNGLTPFEAEFGPAMMAVSPLAPTLVSAEPSETYVAPKDDIPTFPPIHKVNEPIDEIVEELEESETADFTVGIGAIVGVVLALCFVSLCVRRVAQGRFRRVQQTDDDEDFQFDEPDPKTAAQIS